MSKQESLSNEKVINSLGTDLFSNFNGANAPLARFPNERVAKHRNVQGGWDTWGKEEDEVTRQIREYRTSLATARQKQNEPEEPEVQADYFQDMIPRVTKAPRVKLSAQEEQVDASRSSLMFAAQPMPIVGGELGTWVEEEGWEAEDAGNWEEEVRRAQREKRAQELQMKRAEHRGGLGERMS